VWVIEKIWNIFEFSVQKYIRNRHFSSWDKMFVDQCNQVFVRLPTGQFKANSIRVWNFGRVRIIANDDY